MILYLDDWRRAPEGEGYRSATNYPDFIMLIDTYRDCIEEVDLDYDLGYDSSWTGLDVLKYMKMYDIACEHINIHSSHPRGCDMMLQSASANFPDSIVTGR